MGPQCQVVCVVEDADPKPVVDKTALGRVRRALAMARWVLRDIKEAVIKALADPEIKFTEDEEYGIVRIRN